MTCYLLKIIPKKFESVTELNHFKNGHLSLQSIIFQEEIYASNTFVKKSQVRKLNRAVTSVLESFSTAFTVRKVSENIVETTTSLWPGGRLMMRSPKREQLSSVTYCGSLSVDVYINRIMDDWSRDSFEYVFLTW